MKPEGAEPRPRQSLPSFISDEEADAALHYLISTAAKVGSALRDRVEAEHMLKHYTAIEYLKADGPASTREAIARASEKFKEYATKAAVAAGEHQKLLAARDAAQTRIDMWRTQQSSIRAAARL